MEITYDPQTKQTAILLEMYSNENKQTAQTGKNLTTGFDQVQSSVAGASFTNSGKSKHSLPQSNNDNELDQQTCTTRSEDAATRVNQKELMNTWKGVEELVMQNAKPQATISTGDIQTTPTIRQTKSTLRNEKRHDGAMDVDGTLTLGLVRRTNAEELLVVLNTESSAKALVLRSRFKGARGELAQSKVQVVKLEVKDLEVNMTKEEISAALQRFLESDYSATVHSLKSLRKAYGGTQTAIIRQIVPAA
ncbi:hypothetical protein KM043_008063 [Ampulex compressa]|nr:hypothetical protein KM043_008063 [Ampulex compressa]